MKTISITHVNIGGIALAALDDLIFITHDPSLHVGLDYTHVTSLFIPLGTF